MERVTGIEPAPPAWKAGALPLSYTRAGHLILADSCRSLLPIERDLVLRHHGEQQISELSGLKRRRLAPLRGSLAELGAIVVGDGGFEPPTPWSQTRYAAAAPLPDVKPA